MKTQIHSLGASTTDSFFDATLIVTDTRAPIRVERDLRILKKKLLKDQEAKKERISGDAVKVVLHIDWIGECVKQGECVALDPYRILQNEEARSVALSVGDISTTAADLPSEQHAKLEADPSDGERDSEGEHKEGGDVADHDAHSDGTADTPSQDRGSRSRSPTPRSPTDIKSPTKDAAGENRQMQGARIFSPNCRIYILPIHVPDDALQQLHSRILSLGAKLSSYEEAHVIVTDTRAPVRVERELRIRDKRLKREGAEEQVISPKLVLHTDWLEACELQGEVVVWEKFRIIYNAESRDVKLKEEDIALQVPAAPTVPARPATEATASVPKTPERHHPHATHTPSSASTAVTPLDKSNRLQQDTISGPRFRNWSEKPQGDRELSQSCRIFVLPMDLSQKQLDKLHAQIDQLGALRVEYKWANIVTTCLRATDRVRSELKVLNQQVGGNARMQRELSMKFVFHTDWLSACQRHKRLVEWEEFELVPNQAKKPTSQGLEKSKGEASGQVERAKAKTETSGADNREGEGSTSKKGDSSHEANIEYEKDPTTGETLQHYVGPAEEDEERGQSVEDSGSERASDCGDDEDEKERLRKAAQEQIPLPKRPAFQNEFLSCLRPTPLKSEHNQDLVDELDIIQLSRLLTGDETSASTYNRSLSMLKSYPFPLRENPCAAKKLKGVGEKTYKMVQQFYKTGRIAEAELIKCDPAFQTVKVFSRVYSVGPAKARSLYFQGYRTIEDLIHANIWKPGKTGGTIDPKEALRIFPDLETPIPRVEVEEISKLIKMELDQILPGTEQTIVGGYRRGKLVSNDVDIVCTYPPAGEEGIPSDFHMRALRDNLTEKGILTHTISLHHMSDKYLHSNERLQQMEIIIKLPPSPVVPKSRHRRVDIIFAKYKVYGAAILGWTGSRQYERDIRRMAKKQGLKFHSSGIEAADSPGKVYPTTTEKQALELCGVPWMAPEYRNCDA